jgi:hypothetical protein
MAIFCTQCGASLNDGARFCTACGQPAGQSAGIPDQPDAGSGWKRKLAIGVGVVVALGLAGGAVYGLASVARGAGQADRNGDGIITLDEFRIELLELKRPQPGRWKFNVEGSLPAGSSGNLVQGEFEVEACDERAWRDIDRLFEQLREPEAFDDIEREYRKFRDRQNGSLTIRRFSIDGEDIDFAIDVSGGNESEVMVDGSFELAGMMSEDHVLLEGPVEYMMKGSHYESDFGGSVTAKFEGNYRIEGERISRCG